MLQPSPAGPGRRGPLQKTAGTQSKPSNSTPEFSGASPRPDAERVMLQLRTDEFTLEMHRAEAQRIAAEHQAKLKLPAQLMARIVALEEKTVGARLQIEDWAKANRSEFAGKQSLELIEGGTLIFRATRAVGFTATGKPAELLKRVIAAIQKAKGLRRYLVFKPALDKEKLLKETRSDLVDKRGRPLKPKVSTEALKAVGLCIEHDETFAIDLEQPKSKIKCQAS